VRRTPARVYCRICAGPAAGVLCCSVVTVTAVSFGRAPEVGAAWLLER
jgi:hypothetical protein